MQLLLKNYAKPYRAHFILGSVSKLIEAMLELCLPLFMANIIDFGIANGDRQYIYTQMLYLFALISGGLLFALFCQYTASVASQGTGTILRDAVYEKISTFSYKEIDDFGTATLINRIMSDINYIQQAVAMSIRLIPRAPFLCIGAIIMSFKIDTKLTVIFLVIIPALSMVLFLLMKLVSPLYTRAQQKLDALAVIVAENLSGVRVIRAFARQEKEKKRFDNAAQELRTANNQVANMSALMNPASTIIMNVSVIALLYFGASRVYGGNLSQGDLIALTIYASKILYALIIVANLVVLFTKAFASSERVQEVLSVQPEIVFEKTTRGAAKAGPAIQFDNVSFSYNGYENALEHISFQAAQGETVGFVGVTGSGKTTLLNLLQRFYECTDGSINIKGIPVEQYSQQDLRNLIGIVPQRTVLFSGSIADNISMGCPEVSKEAMVAALKTAQAYEFVTALPEGLETIIQEGGKNFSGGQRQRLAIARALVKKPAILLLDDSLSALDYKTDLMVRQNIKKDLKHTTMVIISQRVSSVVSADKILVLNDGKIEAAGCHNELMQSSPTYQEIYDSQRQAGTEHLSQ